MLRILADNSDASFSLDNLAFLADRLYRRSYLHYKSLLSCINVCIPDGGFPDNIKDIATAIFDKQTDSINKRSILIANLLDYFMEYYKDFKSKSYVKEYIERSMIIGKTITIIEGSKTSVAKAIDIDKNCRLKVQFEDGTTKWLSSGEVSTKIHK